MLEPIKVTVTNIPEGQVDYFELPNHPKVPELGTRSVPFTRELYIDREDFAECPPPKFFRMRPGAEVRLMGAYIVRCNEVIKDENGNVTELLCTADLETGCGNPVDGRKVKGTIHWLSRDNALSVRVMHYDKLFTIKNVKDIPEDKTYNDYLNPNSVLEMSNALVERGTDMTPGAKYQFVRLGYYTVDSKHENTFNRVVSLKDSYKVEA